MIKDGVTADVFYEIQGEHITSPGQLKERHPEVPHINPADGIGFSGEAMTIIRDCVVDFGLPEDRENKDVVFDEAGSMTWGANGHFQGCTFRQSDKLFLCGSGDEHKKEVEKGKTVRFFHCTFEDFTRRGPEVQAGMNVHLEDCIIRNWGDARYFDWENPTQDRIFGAWAHSGGIIVCTRCHFEQPCFWRGLKVMFFDLIGHLGQAIHDEGLKALFNWKNWIPGVCRGLTAGPGGIVEAYDCTKNKWWIRIEGND